jgi:hypothetical protein
MRLTSTHFYSTAPARSPSKRAPSNSPLSLTSVDVRAFGASASIELKTLPSTRRTRISPVGRIVSMTTSAAQWLAAYAAELGIDAPSDAECVDILALAGSAAHASERTAAPVACWLAAKAGLGATEARELAARIELPESFDVPDTK